MARPLPLKLWLAIEEDVARHKVAVAQNFAEARARLVPEPPPPQRDWNAEHARWQMQQMMNAFGSLGQHHQNALAQAQGFDRGDVFGLGRLGF